MNAFVHHYFPHSSLEAYTAALLFAGGFFVVGSLLAFCRKKKLVIYDHFLNAGSGATFPSFALMVAAPYDDHLLDLLFASWAIAGLAGFLGMGMSLYGLWYFTTPHPKNNEPD